MRIPENTLNVIITSIVSSLSNCLLIGNSAEQSVYHMCLTEFGALHIVVQYGLRDKDHRILRWPYYCIPKTTRWASGSKEAAADEEK